MYAMASPPFDRIVGLGRDPIESARQLVHGGHRLLGLVCPNLPEELPHALGLVPFRVVVRPTPPTRSPEVLQTFCCSWVQALLDQAMRGELAHLDAITFSGNTCDSLQNLPDIWRRTVERPAQLHTLRLPVVNQGELALDLLRAEIRQWQGWLERLAGSALDRSRLRASVLLFNRIRAALRQLQRMAIEGRLPYSLVQAAAISAQTHERAEIADLLDAAVEVARPWSAGRARDEESKARVVLAGGCLDDLRLIEWIEQHDAAVVGDDGCALSRSFEPEADLDPQDPLEEMARRHMRRSRCPVQSQSAVTRAAALSQKIQRGEAQGVVLLPYKGCEPHAFDNVILAETLDQLGVPHVTLEIEPHLGNWGQITTRLEAFLEMLSDDGELYGDTEVS